MNVTAARVLVDANAAGLKLFVMNYLLDNGIGVQLIETVAQDLFGQTVANEGGIIPEGTAAAPQLMVSTAVQDLLRIELFSDPEFDLDRVISGAASLEFLVRHARKVNPAVLPPAIIPTDEVVAAALELFHAGHGIVVS